MVSLPSAATDGCHINVPKYFACHVFPHGLPATCTRFVSMATRSCANPGRSDTSRPPLSCRLPMPRDSAHSCVLIRGSDAAGCAASPLAWMPRACAPAAPSTGNDPHAAGEPSAAADPSAASGLGAAADPKTASHPRAAGSPTPALPAAGATSGAPFAELWGCGWLMGALPGDALDAPGAEQGGRGRQAVTKAECEARAYTRCSAGTPQSARRQYISALSCLIRPGYTQQTCGARA